MKWNGFCNSGIGLSSGDVPMDNGSPASTNSGETLLSSVPSTLDDCLERYVLLRLTTFTNSKWERSSGV